MVKYSIPCILLVAGLAQAQTPVCDRLTAPQRETARGLLAGQHPYDCCDDTIDKCLRVTPTCALVVRLANNICRRVADGQHEKAIIRSLSHRARTMMAMGKGAKIDLQGCTPIGDPKSSVVLVEYACGRCPFCAKLTPEIYEAVVDGPLAGKAVFYFKVFPIRSHEGAKASGLAMLAAEQLGGFWAFLLHGYERFDLFCPDRQKLWAKDVGLDEIAFAQLITDPALEKRLVTSKKEGLANGVDATPTFFINGRRYYAELSLDEIVDVVEEEFERLGGRVYVP